MSEEKDLVVVKDEKYLAIVDEIKGAITEAVHNSRWILVEGYWSVGKLIREEFGKGELTKRLQGLAVDVGISERTLWYCLKAHDKYPDIQQIPEGKNISWNKLITKYLPETSELKKKPKITIQKCSDCDGYFVLPEDQVCTCRYAKINNGS